MSEQTRRYSIGSLFLLVAYPVWVTGGTHLVWQGPLLLLGVLVLFALALFCKHEGWGRLVRDPILWLGGALVVLMLVQWLNAGRELVFDADLKRWIYGPAPIAWLPSAVKTVDAAEMLRWFFPAWCGLLACRVCICRGRDARLVLRLFVVNAAILALLATIQHVVAVLWGLCERPQASYCVTSFGYANQAAAFFVLMLFAAIAMSFRETSYTQGRHWTGRITILVVSGVVILLGALVTLSRTGILMAGFAMLTATVYSVFGGGSSVSALERFNRSVAMIALAAAVFWVAWEFGSDDIMAQLQIGARDATGTEEVGRWVKTAGFGGRALNRELSAKALGDHLWFGTGGWGLQYLGGTYVQPERWAELQASGAANVHNDGLQFLTEFGLVGGGLMAAILVVLLMPLIRMLKVVTHLPLLLFGGLGLLATVFHSWIDIPFRAPAILYSWLFMLALLPVAIGKKRGS